MGTVLFVLLIVGILGALAAAAWRQVSSPEARLLRDFGRLRAGILGSLEGPTKDQGRRLLQESETYLRGLLETRRQHSLLRQMASTASEIAGRAIPHGVSEHLEAQVAEQLGRFFASLARISTVVGVQREGALDALQVFSEDLGNQREALLQINQELAALRDPKSFVLPPDLTSPPPAQRPAFKPTERAKDGEEVPVSARIRPHRRRNRRG